MVKTLSEKGLRSEHCYAGGFASIALSIVSYFVSRKIAKNGPDDKAQGDRWGIFVGQWAPTFFALGVALKLEEK